LAADLAVGLGVGFAGDFVVAFDRAGTFAGFFVAACTETEPRLVNASALVVTIAKPNTDPKTLRELNTCCPPSSFLVRT
jgi:hypothetical protein